MIDLKDLKIAELKKACQLLIELVGIEDIDWDASCETKHVEALLLVQNSD